MAGSNIGIRTVTDKTGTANDPATVITGTDVNATKRALDVQIQGATTGLLNDVVYDYVIMALSVGDTVETYTFREGGSGGTITAVVAVTYTTSARSVFVSAERTT